MDDMEERLRRMTHTAPGASGVASDPFSVLNRARRRRRRKLIAGTSVASLLAVGWLALPMLATDAGQTSRVATNPIGAPAPPPFPTTSAAVAPTTVVPETQPSTSIPVTSTTVAPNPPKNTSTSMTLASATTTTSTALTTVVKRPTAACEKPRRPIAAGNGRIAFTGKMGVYTMSPDGSDVRLFKEGEQLASWSPDARRIAFMRSTPPTGIGKLMVASIGSGEELVVANNDHYLGPKWSPDGSHLVSRSSRGLAIVEDDGENQAFVANTDYRDTAATFAPDCDRLVYEYNTGEGVDIYTIKLDGTGRTRLSPDGPGNDSQPDWSPDGTQIAFARRIDDRDTQIFVMRPDGTGVRQLTHEVGWHGYPSWSPDGTMIAYAGQALVNGEWRAPIHVMRADGTDRHHIGPYDSPSWAPDWSSATE